MTMSAPDPDYILRGTEHSPVNCLEYQEGENYLFSGHQNGSVLVWDLRIRRVVRNISAHQGNSILTLALTQNGDMISQGRDGAIHKWDLTSSWKKSDSFTSGVLGFCSCRVFKMGNDEMLVATSEDKSSMNIYSLSNRRIVATLTPVEDIKSVGMCMTIRVLESEEVLPQILAGYENGSISLWDTSTWKECTTLKCHNESVMAMDFSSIVNKGFSVTALDTIVQWEIKDGREIKLLNEQKITNPGLNCISIRKDGKLFATGGWDSQARLFGCKKMKPLAVLSYHSASIQCVKFLDDNTLVLGSKDGCISFWSLYK